MPDPRWQRIKDLFAAAAALPAAEREEYLRVQGADEEMVREVRSLLAAHPPTAGRGGDDAIREGPGSRIGPYKLLECIGEGGFGTVFAAEQEAPVRRRVALKVLKAGMDTHQVVARFEQERQALALMDHPNIARVFDGGSTPGGRPFFVMELVRGDPITDYCDRERLNPAERLRLFTDVGRAVQHAHQKGVIHRDLKPSNVLVTIVDGRPVAKVIDFGVAKATQGRLTDRTLFTEHKQMIGTPLYMSPEQAHISGVDVDTRSDVYSLGVLLYELLTGTTPFRREELLEAGLLEMHRVLCEVEPQKPSTRVATLGKTSGAIAAQRRVDAGRLGGMLRGDLDWIVMKCLEKERSRRYETASDLVRDVERHLAGEAVLAAPPSVAYRLRKLVRRRRGQVAAAAAVFVVAGAGIASVLWSEQKRADDAVAASARLQAAADEKVFGSYVDNIRVAEGALRNHDVRTARRRLEACPEHLRHWEWRYLQAASERSEHVLVGHTGPVLSVAYSPDGQRVVTASRDGSARIWDAGTGQQLAVLEDPGAAVTLARFSADGKWIATLSEQGHVVIWDGLGRGRVATLVDGDSKIDSVAFSPNHRRLATVAGNGTASTWTLATWQRERVLDHGGQTEVRFSADGSRLVTWSKVSPPTLWDAETGAEVKVLRGHPRPINDVAFGETGQLVWTASSDGTWRTWSTADGAKAGFGNQAANVRIVRSAHGRVLMVLDDNSVELGHTIALEPDTVVTAHRGDIVHADILPRGDRYVTASRDGTARMWEGEREIAVFLGHTDAITSADVRTDGRQLATSSQDGTCRLWDLENTWESRHVIKPNANLWHVDISSDGSSVLAGDSQSAFTVDLTSGRTITVQRSESMLLSARFLDTRGIVLRRYTSPTELRDPISGSLVHTFPDDGWPSPCEIRGDYFMHCPSASAFVVGQLPGNTKVLELPAARFGDIDRKGTLLAVAGADHSIEIRSLPGNAVLRVLRAHHSPVRSLAFSPDGSRLLTRSEDHAVRIWNVATGEGTAAEAGEHHDPIWSPDGTMVVTWSKGGIRILDAATGATRAILRTTWNPPAHDILQGDRCPPYDFSPDGARMLVTLCDDGSPSVWDTTHWVELLQLRHYGNGSGLRARFSSDGTRVVTCVYIGDLVVWDSVSHAARLRESRPISMAIERALARTNVDVDASLGKTQGTAPATAIDSLADRIAYTSRREQIVAEGYTMRDRMRLVCRSKADETPTSDRIDAEDVLRKLRRALEIAPTDWNLQQMLGVTQHRCGLHAAAVATLERLIHAEGRAPAIPIEWAFLAMSHARLGDRDAASTALGKLMEEDPDNLGQTCFGVPVGELQRQAQAVFAECFPSREQGK